MKTHYIIFSVLILATPHILFCQIDSKPCIEEKVFFKNAVSCIEGKDIQCALENLDSAIFCNSQEPHYFFMRGAIKYRLKNFKLAKNDFIKAVKIKENYKEALYFLALIEFNHNHDHNKAVRYFDNAIKIDNHYYDAIKGRSAVYRSSGNFKSALEDLENAKRISSDKKKKAECSYEIGMLFREQKNYSKAIQAIIEAKKNDPKNQGYKQEFYDLLQEYRDASPTIWILTVAIGQYRVQKLLPPLSYPVSDSRNFLDTMVKHSLLQVKSHKLENDRAYGDSIIYYMDNFLSNSNRIKNHDVVILYFSGHGLTLRDRPGICPFDYLKPNNLISFTNLLEQLSRSPAYLKYCFIESCKSSVESYGLAEIQGVKDSIISKEFNRRNNTDVIFFSSSQLGQDSYGENSGYFSKYLSQGLAGSCDINDDGIIRVKELFDYINQNLETDLEGLQTPHISPNDYNSNSIILISKDILEQY